MNATHVTCQSVTSDQVHWRSFITCSLFLIFLVICSLVNHLFLHFTDSCATFTTPSLCSGLPWAGKSSPPSLSSPSMQSNSPFLSFLEGMLFNFSWLKNFRRFLFFNLRQTFSEWDLRTWLLCLFQSVIGIIGAMLMTKVAKIATHDNMKCIFQAVCWVTPAKTMVIRSLQIIVAYAIQVPLYSRKC